MGYFILGESISPIRWLELQPTAWVCSSLVKIRTQTTAPEAQVLKVIYFFLIVVAGTAGEADSNAR